MKPFYQFAAAVMLLLFFGVSGADCLIPNAQMSAAEKGVLPPDGGPVRYGHGSQSIRAARNSCSVMMTRT
jgi:hypothetical protein